MAARETRDTAPDVQETGNLFVLYRPKVEHEAAASQEDIERLHVVLRPKSRALWRLLVVGAKRLPDLRSHERNWGFVDRVLRQPEEVREFFAAQNYETKTRGTRHLAPARPAGEGVYALVRRSGQMHLACRLELPEAPGPVQEALGIPAEAVYALSIKNPEAPGAALLGDGKARWPKRLQAGFKGRRYEGESAAPLDHEGVEFLLTGVEARVGAALSSTIEAEDETSQSSDLLKLLGTRRERTATEPLIESLWA
ncbi:hypothetical protein [uncultured Enterovirga sp.]|uniref:hypothetical protein n=1 Tax=uncultured Enterovirga sp. TaxID=2026352 RepID=UPI0035CAF0A5